MYNKEHYIYPKASEDEISQQQQKHHHHWSDFLNYHNKIKPKKKNSRSKSMFEITENPYADENCYCCNNNNSNNDSSSSNDSNPITRPTSINASLICSILTASTIGHHHDTTAMNSSSSSQAYTFLLKFSHLLVSSGAPSHRLDHCLQLLMEKLEIKAQFGYFPGFLVVSFGDIGT